MKTARPVKGIKDLAPAGVLSPARIRDWIDAGCPTDMNGLNALEEAAALVILSLSNVRKEP